HAPAGTDAGRRAAARRDARQAGGAGEAGADVRSDGSSGRHRSGALEHPVDRRARVLRQVRRAGPADLWSRVQRHEIHAAARKSRRPPRREDLTMPAPIGFGGGPGGMQGPRRLGLDIAGENGLSRLNKPNGADSFGDTLKRVLNDVSNTQDVSQNYIDRFVRGEPVEAHQVMRAAEETAISLESVAD